VHPPPELLARLVHAIDERDRLRAIGGADAGLVRVDEEAVSSFADAVLLEQRVDLVRVGLLRRVVERERLDPELLVLLSCFSMS
jgi:hypothetical protein